MEANGSPSHISTKIQLFILDYLDRAQINSAFGQYLIIPINMGVHLLNPSCLF